MRTYDCQHRTVNSLEKELLFEEVMRLRNRIVDAESMLLTIQDESTEEYIRIKVAKFLKHKKEE